MMFTTLQAAADEVFTDLLGNDVRVPKAARPISLHRGGRFRLPGHKISSGIGVLKEGQLYLIAARPGIGKTEYLLRCALVNAKCTARPVYYVSAEMGTFTTVCRFVKALTGTDLRSGFDRENRREMKDLMHVWSILRGLPIFLLADSEDRSNKTAEQLHEAMKRTVSSALIMFDTLQFFSSEKQVPRSDLLKTVAAEFKGIAEDCSSVVIASTHVGRECETREDKMPLPRDIPDGILEYADCLLGFTRKDFYDHEAEPGFTVGIRHLNGSGAPAGTEHILIEKEHDI